MEKRMHRPQVYLHPPKKRFRRAHYIVAAVVIALILIIALISVKQKKEDPVLVTVNGQAIMAEEVKIIRLLLPDAASATDSMLLNDTLIPQTLLLQDAAKRGIEISDSQLSAYIDDALKTSGNSKEALESNLEKAGIEFNDFTEFVRVQMIIDELKKQIFAEAKLEIAESDVQAFYEQNKDQMPPGTTYESVKPTLINFLIQQKQNDFLMQYAANLRSKATIVFM